MGTVLKLSELSVGATAVVQSLESGSGATLRLREMGFLKGTSVTLVRTAPLGDPLEIKVRGYRLTLRRSEAQLVVVEVGPASPANPNDK